MEGKGPMGKFVFKEYHIKLHGKEYDILVPSVNITEMWAFPMSERNKLDNWDMIQGNRLAMHTLLYIKNHTKQYIFRYEIYHQHMS